MNRSLVVEPEADSEVSEVAAWYAEHSLELCRDFLGAIDLALAAVQQNPYQYQVVFKNVRRVLVGRFPYMLMYTASDDRVIVAACLHCRRDPGVGQRRFLE